MLASNPRNISPKTHKMLWGRAASRCAFPGCRRELVMDSTAADAASLFGEACHIVANTLKWSRGNSPITSKQRDEYDNLLLLCNIHHKVIDDQPNTYPVERLKAMKAKHEQWVRESLKGGSPIWNVPYERNSLFTGRENLLNILHDRLTKTKAAALAQPQAITGLGGIGKTQIALEYVYSYRDSYHAVFWVRASTLDTLVFDYVTIAGFLCLLEKDAQDQSLIVLAVKRWLAENTNWLLILDNADDLEMVRDFLPMGGKGHILFTTRTSATRGIATRLEVDKMEREEGMILLLRCAKILQLREPLAQVPSEQQTYAETIVNMFDGLPLALDQAGAYIEETGCSLIEYLTFYHFHRKELLHKRGTLSTQYPESVATTWSLSFEQVERKSPPAADLLRICAFLDADAIPEEMIIESASHLGPLLASTVTDSFQFAELVQQLNAFSLIQRNGKQNVLRLHRLVQAVVIDNITLEAQRMWAKRVVYSVNTVFPLAEVNTWSQCERYLPHALICAKLVVQYNFIFYEAARLLNEIATYLQDHARFTEAEQLYQRALSIREQVLGLHHPATAQSLNNLAVLYNNQGRYDRAEQLFQRSLDIYEQVLGSHHPDTLGSLNNLANLYNNQGKDDKAEQLYQRVLSIYEQVLGLHHPATAQSLNNLAVLYEKQDKDDKAEQLYERALNIYEQVMGPQHPVTETILENYTALLKKRQQT